MNTRLSTTLVLCAFVILPACSRPTVTDVALPGDETASCSELKSEYATAKRLIAEARDVKGVTEENVARRVLFWPAIIGTHMNANEAIDAANTRQVHLLNLMRGKGCEGLEELVN